MTMDHTSATEQAILSDLISLWQRRRAEGQTVTPGELCRDRPDLLPELEQRIAVLEWMAETPKVIRVAASSDSAGSPQAAAAPARWPNIPGYEIVGELGRGGMGVVYKARQTQLDRMVALKMILSGGMADQDDLARFRTEAEAIARLQHANIVQIHEVGEHDGRPFFSLEFCAGGSLADKLNGTPLPAERAASLVETLAQAMEAAHQSHVIHRDLKPANVLLTADGTPKITDFGLAKKLDVPGQTYTGAVMGTPSYMAPEQASGQKDIGPAADVYALGAILYELLTGRPPFKAATTVDTILQVRYDEPVPPRQLQSKVPRDVETICLKCLQKMPNARYARALDLAEDLRRFRAGEPIRARPPGPLERGWKLARRYPGWAAALVVLAAGFLVSAILAGIAKQEAKRAERNAALRLTALDDVLLTISSERLRRAGQTRLMHEMLERLAPRFEEVLTLPDQDDATRAQQGLAWNSLTVIRRTMNKHEEALESAGRAEAIFRALIAGSVPSASNRLGLASALSHSGLLLGQAGKFGDAIGKLDEASRLLAGILEERGEDAALRYQLALAHNNWANCLMRSQNVAIADAHYREAIQHMDAAIKDQPGEIRYRDWKARALSNLALLCGQRKQLAEGRRHSAEAVAIARRISDDFPGEIDSRECLATCLSNEGELALHGGDIKGSLAPFREALGLYEGLARQVPSYVEFPWGRAMAESNLAAALAAGPRPDWTEAEKLLRHADELYQGLTKANPGNQELQGYVKENRERLQRLEEKRKALR
ncbi:MAG TPA: protein kinase [Gemmataceae bacterium]|nr:protein kinase [Gemmataceae bacterium]